jgi:hypothetical protein
MSALAESLIPRGRGAATATIKVDPELVRKARQTAALNDEKLQDYIDRILRPAIERDHARALRRIVEEQTRKSAGGPPPPSP